LVRKICQVCIYSYDADPAVLEILKKQLEQDDVDQEKIKLPKILYKGKGCTSCGMTGYRGRLGIYEAFEVDEKMKELIVAPNFDLAALRNQARSVGMRTMFEDGLQKVELAQTTLEEVLRVIRE
jgi:type IV pilus assembly protein PilB